MPGGHPDQGSLPMVVRHEDKVRQGSGVGEKGSGATKTGQAERIYLISRGRSDIPVSHCTKRGRGGGRKKSRVSYSWNINQCSLEYFCVVLMCQNKANLVQLATHEERNLLNRIERAPLCTVPGRRFFLHFSSSKSPLIHKRRLEKNPLLILQKADTAGGWRQVVSLFRREERKARTILSSSPFFRPFLIPPTF